MKSEKSNWVGESYKTSQFFVLILVGVFALLSGLIVGLFGTAEWIGTEDPLGPLPGVVKSHNETSKEVPTGQRAERRMVNVVEIEVSYEMDGKEHMFSIDRAPPLAETQFPVGQSLDVYRIGERATLTPEDDLVFGPVLIFIGFGTSILGLLLIGLGGTSLRRRLRTKP